MSNTHGDTASDIKSKTSAEGAAAVAAAAEDDGLTRRNMLGLLGASLVGLPWIGSGLAALAYYVSVPERSFTGAVTPEEVPAGLVSDLKDGIPKSIMFGDTTVYVVKQGSAIKALSAVCPHAGCVVGWHESEKNFYCPCHGGTFTVTGECTAGPPPRGMFEHDVKVSMGRVVVGRKKDV